MLNLGAIQAHWGLYPAQTGGAPEFTHLARAQELLLDAQALDPGMLSAYELLGRIYAWQGEPQAALQALSYRVVLDGEDALVRYFPSGSWLRGMQGFEAAPDQDWRDLITVYSYWRDRFPQRSMSYVEMGMVYQCHLDDPDRAASLLRTGIEVGAVPGGLLETYAGMLEAGDRSLCRGR
jgi:tetratricopeptide (TPR) repeat protein